MWCDVESPTTIQIIKGQGLVEGTLVVFVVKPDSDLDLIILEFDAVRPIVNIPRDIGVGRDLTTCTLGHDLPNLPESVLGETACPFAVNEKGRVRVVSDSPADDRGLRLNSLYATIRGDACRNYRSPPAILTDCWNVVRRRGYDDIWLSIALC